MALKLCISSFNVKKLEEVFYKGSKGPAKLLCRYVPKQCQRPFHKYPQGSRQLALVSLKQSRSISIPAALFGKVVPFKLSDIGEGIVEVTVKEWFVKPGDKISQFDNICEVQSDKASVTITSRYDGVVKKLCYEVDEMAKVGAPLIDIELDEEQDSESESDEEEQSKPSSSESKSSSNVKQDFSARALATPAVRRIAKENNVRVMVERNVDIQQIVGTGKGGRVLKEDILSHLENKTGALKDRQTYPPPPPPAPSEPEQFKRPSVQLLGQDRNEPITGFKKAMYKTMVAAWKVPHFAYSDEVDLTELVKFKPELSRLGQAHKVKLTFMPFFIKAASLALTKYPELNANLEPDAEYLSIKASHNIGVSMDTAFGLVVPNIKAVQQLNVIEVARELNRLQDLGAKGRLGLDDLKGGTFTLSNIGAIGGTYTKPILLVPEIVIGGLGKVQVYPRYDANKNVVETPTLIITWVGDHRVVDGATIARFSNLWKAYLANPELILQL